MLHIRCTWATPWRSVVRRSCKKMQSCWPAELRTSRKLVRPPTVRQYLLRTSVSGIFRCSAKRCSSSSPIHINPGGPEQQLPHWEQVKRNPSAYQGSCGELLSTESFILLDLVEFMLIRPCRLPIQPS